MNIQALSAIFLEGLLSFLSPCVLPMIPLYMSYLAGNNKEVDEEGKAHYHTGKVFLMTFFFVLGICLTFVLLALSASKIHDSLGQYNEIIMIIGGTLLIIFGLHETGIIHIDILNKQFSLKAEALLENMNGLKAFALGFVFSLGWSPCIGPLMSNAILMAASSPEGYLYIVAYGLGLIIPFLITGLFTSYVLNFIKEKKNLFRYVMIIAGIVLIGFGIYMISNASRNIIALKNRTQSTETAPKEKVDIEDMLYNYELKDLEGNTRKLSDCSGKYIFLNFTTTWCPYCKEEMPELERFCEEEGIEGFYIMAPYNEGNGLADIEKFMSEVDHKLPVLVDEEGFFYYYCQVNSYPTTFVISPEGKFLTYINGALQGEMFSQLFEYAKSVEENLTGN